MIFINEHEVKLDESEGLLPWTDYDRVIRLAMGFIRRCPVEPRSGLPWYLVYSCFWTDPLRPTIWPDNPAGKFAMAVETLVRYQAYSGETWMIDVARQMLDRLAVYQTPPGFAWPGMPYASAEPVLGEYRGARADGLEVIEPDKAAQAALAYLRFHQITGEAAYLERAVRCARTLAAKRRAADAEHSPWPFRVNARTGQVVEQYTSHVIAAVRLFEELTALGADEDGLLAGAAAEAMDWLRQFPLADNVWKGYFEDIRLDPENRNRDQYSPLETARYLLDSARRSEEDTARARGIVEWVERTLAAEPFFKAVAIHEQLFCYHVMGSHTARYASLCAALHACTSQPEWRERAIRSLNWATYMATEEGIVLMGVDRPDYYNQCWFTDSYFDYVPHFIDAMCSIPSLAPDDQDHLLGTSSVVQRISYRPLHVSYTTFHPHGEETLRLSFVPREITCDGRPLAQRAPDAPVASSGWCFEPAEGVLRVQRGGQAVAIRGEPVTEGRA